MAADDLAPPDRDDPVVRLLAERLPRLEVSDEWLRATISVALDQDELWRRRTARLERRLAAAASSPGTRPEQRVSSDDGRLVAHYRENVDGWLEVEVAATEYLQPLVLLRWTIDGEPENERLTPLAATSAGWTARYQLTVLRDVDEVALHPPAWADAAALDERAVRRSIGDGAYGVSLRAWRALLDGGQVPAALEGLVRRLLDDHGG